MKHTGTASVSRTLQLCECQLLRSIKDAMKCSRLTAPGRVFHRVYETTLRTRRIISGLDAAPLDPGQVLERVRD